MEVMDKVFGFLITGILTVGALLLLRTVALWYWRVNEALGYLKSIDSSLKVLRVVAQGGKPNPEPDDTQKVRRAK